MTTRLLILGLMISGFSLTAYARPDCKKMAVKAGNLLSEFNSDNRKIVSVKTSSDDATKQVVEIIFDLKEQGASITYTVTVDRNASPNEDNQVCARVSKIELTGEE